MATNVFFKTVENYEELQTKGIPWRCDKCHEEDNVFIKMTIDYGTLVLCKKCLLEAKKLITDLQKELKNESKSNLQPKEPRR